MGVIKIDKILNILLRLVDASKVTISLTIVAALLASVIAFVSGILLLNRHKIIRFLVRTYVEIFRGTSLLVQLYWIYFVLPFFGIELPKFTAGVVAIALNYGAYSAEIVRAGFLSVPKEQIEAAKALNFTSSQRMRYIIFPQAIRIMLPGLGNQMIELIKGTALVSLIGLEDLTYSGVIMRTNDIADTFIIFILILLIYYAISTIFASGFKLLEKRANVGRA
ncbi:polar amino acid transport system permease protein [Thermoanaerobacter uzonensis DSM 18761]|uniref:Polar amino acid transport system permease protein n=1 Tax=Thermoanaerobacter uzonensis DSM 18761 TaxID=1123369 RepID=A0A1M5AY39_9THEO|nr:polar amino acid transport system permease protein [Thermoanaerobacter uzonensis DSM 18761]